MRACVSFLLFAVLCSTVSSQGPHHAVSRDGTYEGAISQPSPAMLNDLANKHHEHANKDAGEEKQEESNGFSTMQLGIGAAIIAVGLFFLFRKKKTAAGPESAPRLQPIAAPASDAAV